MPEQDIRAMSFYLVFPPQQATYLNRMRILVVSLVVVALVSSGFLVAKFFVKQGTIRSWDPDRIYAVWCVAAEVASRKADGRSWDEDGSPPDLSAEIFWRDNCVLKSATSRNALIANWDRSSLKISDLFRTEYRPGDLDKVARIKADSSEILSIKVYDRDLLGSELVGDVRFSVGELHQGINRVELHNSESGLQSVSLQVVPAEILEAGGQVSTDLHVLSPTVGKPF